MASTLTKTAPGGGHTSGIYSDMTVDGPEIGDLVVIVDKAKNLPNRKTMGKQDPYCACRLGKEAKKTTTDRRGGQTPRWDQELRFTVHDSLDYYQIKVTVFNDDKKTDLIGETWVSLESVIVPGGGQSDMWHNLNCKGKYAGEIRIEMTYYDTRPKDEAVIEKRRDAVRSSMTKVSKEMLGGPRQPKAPKRRPLPGQPSTSQQPPSPAVHEDTYRDATPSNTQSRASYDPREGNPRQSAHQPPPLNQFPSYIEPLHPTHHQQSRHTPQNSKFPPSHIHNEYDNSMEDDYDIPSSLREDDYDARRAYGNQQQSQSLDFPDSFDDLPDGPPPPPPVHSSRHASPAADHYPVAAPPPLMHHSASDPYQSMQAPYSRVQSQRDPAEDLNMQMRSHSLGNEYQQYDSEEYNQPPQPLQSRRSSKMAAHPEAYQQQYNSSDVPRRRSANGFQQYQEMGYDQLSPVESHSDMPSSLVPGYNPVAQNHSRSRSDHTKNQPAADNFPPHSPVHHPIPSHLPNTPQDHFHARHGSSPTKPSPLADGQRAHQSPYSVVKPRAISPDPRTPARKSVSPQPQSQPRDERRLSGIPFSPDSYDALNPNAGSSPPAGPEYHTPDQARDAARRSRRGDPDEPIRTSDGRIIDPSDHIPVDNWAPEPERKSPTKRTSQVNSSSRPSPTGAQPMPPSTRRPYRESGMRPIVTPTPIYAHQMDPQSQSPSSGRNRLQKKTRPQDSSPVHAAPSSPFAASSAEHSPRSPVDYPLRERQNLYGGNPGYGSYSNSPRGSPAGPPPIPAKIPIEGNPQDRLSEELRNIDIGGSRRRNRY